MYAKMHRSNPVHFFAVTVDITDDLCYIVTKLVTNNFPTKGGIMG